MKYLVVAILTLTIITGIVLINNNPNKRLANGTQVGVGGGPNTETNNVNIKDRAKIHTLLQEHVVLASLHLQKLYNGEDTKESAQKLRDNSLKIGDYFNNNQNIIDIWNQHIEEYENYTIALKNDDKVIAKQAKQDLSKHAEQFGQLINTSYPNIPANNATNAMEEHGNLTLSVIDAHAKNDNTAKAEQMAKASAQAVQFAEILVH